MSVVLSILLGHCIADFYSVSDHYHNYTEDKTYDIYARKRVRKKRTVNPEEELFSALITKAVDAVGVGKVNLAVSYFEKALLLKEDFYIYWNLGNLYVKVNQLDKALASINKYLAEETRENKKAKAEALRQKILSRMKEQYLKPTVSPTVKSNPVPINKQASSGFERDPRTTSNKYDSHQQPRFKESPKDSNRVENNQIQEDRSWIIWGVTSLSLLSVSVGLHLYADMTWQGRPMGGGSEAESVQSQAVVTSWIADGFLVSGIITLGVGIYRFIKRRSSTSNRQSYRARSSVNSDPYVVRQVVNTLHIPAKPVYARPTAITSLPIFIW